MKPISPFADLPGVEPPDLPETTRYGRRSGLCAGGVLALVAVVLLTGKGGIAFLFLLFWCGPVALIRIIAGVTGAKGPGGQGAGPLLVSDALS